MTRETPCCPVQELPGRGAGGIQLAQRYRLLVSGNLEDAVRRGVHDPAAGPPMLRSILVQHRGSGGRLVAEHARDRSAGRTPSIISEGKPRG